MKLRNIGLLFASFFMVGTVMTGCSDGTEKAIKKIQISKKPNKMTYNVGELFDPTGMELLTLAFDGTTSKVTKGYTWDLTEPLGDDDDEVMIMYKSRSALLEIDLNIEYPKSLEIKQLPNKTTYVIGEKFDPTGLILTGTFEDEETKEEYTKDISTGFRYSKTKLTAGVNEWKVTYNKCSIMIPISVDNAKVVEIAIATPPTKTTYNEGEFFSTDGMTIVGNLNDGTSQSILDYSYSPMRALEATDTEVTISYGDFTCTQPITVNPVPLKVSIKTNPDKLDYQKGEDIDPTGMVVEKVENGVPTVLSSSEYTIIGGNNLQIGSIPEVQLNADTSIKTRIPAKVVDEVNVTMTNVKKASGSGVSMATNETLKATATNEDYVKDFSENDEVTIEFNSLAAGKAKLFIKSASTYVTEYSANYAGNKQNIYWPVSTGTVQANKLFEVYLNDVKVLIPDTVTYEGSTTGTIDGNVLLLAQWRNVEMNNVDITVGKNVIKMKFLKQIYKNADLDYMNGDKPAHKSGVLSSPVLDTVSMQYDCLSGIVHEHNYVENPLEQYLKSPANCQHRAVYYKSCICGDVSTETFEYGELGEHTLDYTEEGGQYYEVCTTEGCNYKKEIDKPHNFAFTASEANNVQTLNGSCTDNECDAVVEKTLDAATVGKAKTDGAYSAGTANKYFDLGSENLFGTNDLDGITDTDAATRLKNKGDRKTAAVKNSGSSTVQLALVKASGCDYVNNFYNGAGFKVNYTASKEVKAVIVVKASTGYLTNTSNGYTSGNMIFNKVFKLTINGVECAISDSLILPGKAGNYGDANANFVCLPIQVTLSEGANEIKFTSFASYDNEGKVLYHDNRKATDTTMSSPNVDTVAIYEL